MFYPFFSDDSFISLRYVQRFLDGLGLTWNGGKPVEGYSNFLWVMLTSAMGALGLDLIFSARFLGYLFSISTLWVIIEYAFNRTRNLQIVLFPLLLFTTSSIVATWTIGGLEQPLYVFLALLSITKILDYLEFGNNKSLLISSLASGFLCLTRPDGLMITVLITFFLIAVSKKKNVGFKEIGTFIAIPIVFTIFHLIFRIVYYGQLVPNTAFVKVSPSFYHFMEGMEYIYKFFRANLILIPIVIYTLYFSFKSKSISNILLLIIIFSWIFYISLIGGDIFASLRHHYLTFALIILLLIDVLKGINANKLNKPLKNRVLLLALCLAFGTFYYQQFHNSNYTRAKREIWEWELKTLSGKLIKSFGNQQPLIAVDAAGALPYWTQFAAIDMLGLNDYHIARNKSNRFGSGYIGHELGDDKYVLSKKPDIIIFHIGKKYPQHYSDTLLYNNQIFKKKYIPVPIFIDSEYDYKGYLWFNKESEKVGIIETEDYVAIPTYLLRNEKEVYCKFNKQHKLIRSIAPNEKVTIEIAEKYNLATGKYIDSNGLEKIIESHKDKSIITIKNTSSESIDIPMIGIPK